MNEEHLFSAIGAAEDALLCRSEAAAVPKKKRSKIWRRGGLAAAACFVLLAAAALQLPDPTIDPVHPTAQSIVSQTGASVGSFHLFSRCYAAESPSGTMPDFALYYNDSIYYSRQDDNVFLLRPIDQTEISTLPECKLEIRHWPGTAPEDARAQLHKELSPSYTTVADLADFPKPSEISLHADNGTDWDAAQLDAWFFDDRSGGTFVLISTYFTEATEGHGVRFADIANTFRVSDAAAEAASPAWVASLHAAAEEAMDAFFANAPQDIAPLLADNASFYTYGMDVRDNVSISGIDYQVDNDAAPSKAIVSVAHRVNLEDSMTYITMELVFQDGAWYLTWAGLEK